MRNMDIYEVFENSTVLDRDEIENLRKALNCYVAHEIQTNYGGRFVLENIITLLAVAVYNQDGNLARLVDALASASSTLHRVVGMPYSLAHELQHISDKLFSPSDLAEVPCWESANSVAYPIKCVLVDRKTGNTIQANLHEETIEVSGTHHDRGEFLYENFPEAPKPKYKIVALEEQQNGD